MSKGIIMHSIKQSARYLSCALLLSLILQSTTYPSYSSHYWHKNIQEVTATAIVGLVCAGVFTYLVGCGFGLWDQSNERLIASGNQRLQEFEQYRPMVHIVSNDTQFDPRLTFDEAVLYQLAFAKRGKESIDHFLITLKNDAYSARQLCTRLEQRSFKLKKNVQEWHEMRPVCYALDEVSSKLYNVVKNLEVLAAHMEAHISYFKLFECEDYVRNYYAPELMLLDQYNDLYALREGVRVCALGKFSGPFALIAFVNNLKSYIVSLEDLVLRSSYNYATRIAYVRDLIARLQHIERITASDNEYMHVLLEYQREQREKEALLVQKERIRVEERKAQACQRMAAAQETSNALKAVEIVAKHNRAHA